MARPVLYSREVDFMLTVAVDSVKADARDGRAPRNITTDKAACEYIATRAETAPIRDELGLPQRIDGKSLAVRLSEAKRRMGITKTPPKVKV